MKMDENIKVGKKQTKLVPDTKQNKQKDKTEYLVIKIPKPKNIERWAWVAVTLILAVIAFYGPISDTVSNSADYVTASLFGAEETVGGTVTDTEEEAVVEEVVEETEEVVEEEPEVVEEEVEEEKTLSGLINFKVIKVNTVKKSDDWGKVLSVNYEIDNQKDDFYPLIKVFTYDDDDGSDVKNTVKGEQTSITPVVAGEVKEGVVSLTDGSFDNLAIPKTVTVHLFDQTTDKLVKAVTTIVDIK